jgi:hypothetical protein
MWFSWGYLHVQLRAVLLQAASGDCIQVCTYLVFRHSTAMLFPVLIVERFSFGHTDSRSS